MADPPNDDLLRRARELGRRAETAPGPAKGRLRQVLQTIRPIVVVLAMPVRWMLRWFFWAAYVETDDGGRRFSLSRFGLRLGISLAALIGAHVALSAIYFYATAFEETVYVTGKQEIETGELYQFGGCTSLPCSTDTDNGKFFLIESSLYFPTMFYPEENVFANIPQQDAACHVRGYGIYFRSLRWLYKSAQLYQHVVNVSCRPYTEDEIRSAVGSGNIIDAGDR